jgi:hypothetical protein
LFRQQSLRRDVLGERTIFATVSLARENPFPQAFGDSKRPEVKIAKASRASRAGATRRSAHLQTFNADSARQSAFDRRPHQIGC